MEKSKKSKFSTKFHFHYEKQYLNIISRTKKKHVRPMQPSLKIDLHFHRTNTPFFPWQNIICDRKTFTCIQETANIWQFDTLSHRKHFPRDFSKAIKRKMNAALPISVFGFCSRQTEHEPEKRTFTIPEEVSQI